MDLAERPRSAVTTAPPQGRSGLLSLLRAGLRPSYIKTIVSAAAAGAVAIVLAHYLAVLLPSPAQVLAEAIGWTLGLELEVVAAGGLVVMLREGRDIAGRGDLFLMANATRSDQALLAAAPGASPLRWARAARRALGQGWPLVGEDVEIRSLDEIRSTLDVEGRLDGLPFMPEMARFCGQRVRVFRRVDKVYDYGGAKTLRRMKDAVLLAGLRCDGSSHGGCQASCYLLWRSAWLRPSAGHARAVAEGAPAEPVSAGPCADRTGRYTCQFTELVAASRPLARWDIRQDLRPLLAGNVSVGAFFVALLTRAFNAAQRARGGTGYPAERQGDARRSEGPGRKLVPGDLVRVQSREAIFGTLDARGRTRGLWFDADMLKHCGRRHTVRARVDRIIDDASGRMLTLKTPSVMLEGVDASGEYLRFCAQHEFPFWREEWLSRELTS